MNWLLRRLREPSTWRGLVWLATVAGLSLRPEQAEAIVTVGMALAGLLGVFLVDTNPPQLPPIELVGRATDKHLADQGPIVPGDAGSCAGAERSAEQSAGRLRQPVPPVDYPLGDADDTYPNLPPSGFGDRD